MRGWNNCGPSGVTRVLSDHNFNERIVRGLGRRVPDLDHVPVRERGYQRAADPQVIDLALAEERVLLTHDIHTLYPLALERVQEGVPCPRVVVVLESTPIGTAIDQLELLLLAGTDYDWQMGALVI